YHHIHIWLVLEMGNADYENPVAIPPPQPFFNSLKYSLKETFFPDDPFRKFKNQTPSVKFVLGLQYFFPIFEWAPKYTLQFLKSDLISGITIASLAIPQGISYAKLANLPPILGLYSSFIPPLIYAMMGSSRDLAVGTVAVGSLLMASMLGRVVNYIDNPNLYLHLAFTATFFAGVLQASLGLFRLGFIVDFLSHATIVGFMGGAATVVCLQQLKSILGLEHFTHEADIVSVMRSVFSQTHQSKRQPKFFWVSAMAPLASVILGSLLVYLTHAEKHGVQVIGKLKKGLNPPSVTNLVLVSPYMGTAIKTGLVTGIIALAEGIAVGRSFAMFKNYHIDGNKEMIAIGTMNIFGSFTSCYLTTGPFSRSAVNYNAGCKTAASNIVMAIAVMLTLLFLTPLFHFTPLVVLSAIIVSAMLGLIDYEAAIHLWKIDKFDFFVCFSAYVGVVFGSVEIGLVIAVYLNHYSVMRNFRLLYLYFEITRWIDEEEDRIKASDQTTLQYVIIDMTAVGNIDTSGISMLEECKKTADRRGLQLVLVNPGSEVMKKLNKSKFLDELGHKWVYLTVEEAVGACNFMLNSYKPNPMKDDSEGWNNA
ncbi:hypothetical protein V8G54_018023, partial [Vigna mungo]